jgi:hypothetical protein
MKPQRTDGIDGTRQGKSRLRPHSGSKCLGESEKRRGIAEGPDASLPKARAGCFSRREPPRTRATGSRGRGLWKSEGTPPPPSSCGTLNLGRPLPRPLAHSGAAPPLTDAGSAALPNSRGFSIAFPHWNSALRPSNSVSDPLELGPRTRSKSGGRQQKAQGMHFQHAAASASLAPREVPNQRPADRDRTARRSVSHSQPTSRLRRLDRPLTCKPRRLPRASVDR